MRIAVTGADGFVGAPLVRRLALHHQVVAVGRRPGGSSDQPGVTRVLCDLARDAAPDVGNLDTVVHLAQSRAFRRFPEGVDDVIGVNLRGTAIALELARLAGARTVVLASSGGVYRPAPGLIDEDSPVEPPNFYLSTKVGAELLACSYRRFFGVVVLRPFFIYGRGQVDMFLPRLAATVASGGEVVLAGPDGIRVNPIHVEDAVAAIAAACALTDNLVINLGGPDVVSIREIAEHLGARLGREPSYRSDEPAAGDLACSIERMGRLVTAPSIRLVDRLSEVCEGLPSQASA